MTTADGMLAPIIRASRTGAQRRSGARMLLLRSHCRERRDRAQLKLQRARALLRADTTVGRLPFNLVGSFSNRL
jgi:hypothetical protein